MQAVIHNEVIDTILERRSVRAYTDERLTESEIQTILQCALWAPSGMNQQTTRMAVTQEAALIAELAEDAGRNGFSYNAPCFIFFYAKKENKWGACNAALAVQNAALAAKALGLDSVVIGCVYDYLKSREGEQKWQKKLALPEDYEFVLGLAVGHGAETPQAKPRNQENIIWK